MQAARADAIRARAQRAKRFRAPSAYRECHRILEKTTLISWGATRSRPEAFWSERWDFAARDETSYERILDWRIEIERSRVVSRYLSRRTVSMMVRVYDPVEGRERWLTVTAAATWWHAANQIMITLDHWASSYGESAKRVTEDYELVDFEDWTRVLEISLLMRPGEAHRGWRSHVRGVIEEKEARAARERARSRPKRKPRAKRKPRIKR